VANPQNILWTGPTTYTDGVPYGQSDHAGYELEINGQPSVAIPVAWRTDNQYSLPVLGLPHLKQGNNAVRMRTVAANGQVSDWTGVVTFPYLSVPSVPANFRVV
jgi:hypothetical protein